MIAIVICVLAFVASYWAGRRSLGQGLLALLVIGYFYGLLRANLLTTFSHFIFDAGLLGLYFSQKWTSSDPKEVQRLEALRLWTALLIIWPMFLVLMPFQPLLVSLVGLRGNIFFIPLLLLGSRLRSKHLFELSNGLAVLNLVALAFAVMEYFSGLAGFYPVSPVTQIIYSSGDVAGGFYRIPAIFTSAHAYGGTMVFSLPFLVGGWDRAQTLKSRLLAVVGLVAALLGILLSATRLNFVLGVGMVVAMILFTRMKTSRRMVFLVVIAGVGLIAMTNTRFQRFKTLEDTDAVAERIAGSVNRGFVEILFEYPMGNGLGGGGTSIPYFLSGQVRNPIGLESEYARILCEQGVLGLLSWVAFLTWFIGSARKAFARGDWANCRKMAWCLSVFSLGTAGIGIGLFTSIPGTVLLLLSMGWTATRMAPETPRVREPRNRNIIWQEREGPAARISPIGSTAGGRA